MPTYSVNNITTYKKYLPNVNISTTSMPNFEKADALYLIPVLTQTVYDALMLQVQNNVITWPTLLALVRSYIVPKATDEELTVKHIAITDGGLKKTVGENMENVFRWEYNEIRAYLQQYAAMALDTLWAELIANAGTYGWTNPLETKSPIKTAKEFKEYYPMIHQGYVVFPSLIPIMDNVMDQQITKLLTNAFYTSLVEKENPDADEKEAIRLIKKAIAYFTMRDACMQLPARLTPNGFTLLRGSNQEQADAGQQAADNSTITLLKETCESNARAYIRELLEFLNEKVTNEKFAAFKQSKEYINPDVQKVDPNKNRNGVFAL